ncbi:hypothetical protein ALGA_0120 [Labilibaculum antarcticum]|uniref:Uncharacterized protein n=1 Tax=Labilibaculum antarcticum TaxID=1717717 RepID=A0A1Y1CDW1_9BACT|nr:hypothetical protein ALGA_0120 [Labilibaculum antarcticum]
MFWVSSYYNNWFCDWIIKIVKKPIFSEMIYKIQTNIFDNLLSNVNFVKEKFNDGSRAKRSTE